MEACLPHVKDLVADGDVGILKRVHGCLIAVPSIVLGLGLKLSRWV
jgi:hypothetical protein